MYAYNTPIIMPCGEVGQTHRILIPTFAGSNPATVAKYPEVQGGGETEKVL